MIRTRHGRAVRVIHARTDGQCKERKENPKKKIARRNARDQITLTKMKTAFVRPISKLKIRQESLSLSQRKR